MCSKVDNYYDSCFSILLNRFEHTASFQCRYMLNLPRKNQNNFDGLQLKLTNQRKIRVSHQVYNNNNSYSYLYMRAKMYSFMHISLMLMMTFLPSDRSNNTEILKLSSPVCLLSCIPWREMSVPHYTFPSSIPHSMCIRQSCQTSRIDASTIKAFFCISINSVAS